MRSWKIKWTHQALKDLEKLENKVVKRVIRKLDQAASDPVKYFNRLVGSDDFKLRIGDHRPLALLSHDTRTILVERVDHQSRIYKKMV